MLGVLSVGSGLIDCFVLDLLFDCDDLPGLLFHAVVRIGFDGLGFVWFSCVLLGFRVVCLLGVNCFCCFGLFGLLSLGLVTFGYSGCICLLICDMISFFVGLLL